MNSKKAALVILDGWGIEENKEVNAIAQANTPYFDYLIDNYSNNTLTTFGEQVGLPDGQMGNSEVGHLNLGAGRVVYQELARINKSFKDQTFEKIPLISQTIERLKNEQMPIHLIGLVSDGGVHSHISHLIDLCNLFSTHGIKIYIHAITDGRDTSPNSSVEYIQHLQRNTDQSLVHISTVIGRYYAMDRDKRWERIKKAYDLLINGMGTQSDDIIKTIYEAYANGTTDEFLLPIKSTDNFKAIQEKDTVLFINFRTDRPRQLTEVLTQLDMHELNMHTLALNFLTMTEYKEDYHSVLPIFTKDNIKNTLGQIVSQHNKTQIRIAETEKYPHVTFFFNGGREEPYLGEKRILVNSPKVATYDLMPEMSAYEVTDKLTTAIKKDQIDLIVINFANTDMVGHTGIMSAAIKAAETVDQCLMKLMPLLLHHGYSTIILADHGNADIMIKPDGSPHTAHTTNPVPVILVNKEKSNIKSGKLGDIAPSLLHLMDIDIPEDMTGQILIE